MTVFHSQSGLAALIAGVLLVHKSPHWVAHLLPRLWPQMRVPGQYVTLKHARKQVICFCSGSKPEIVDTLFNTAHEIWPVPHFKVLAVQEGRLARLRAKLYCLLPGQRWLIADELRKNGHDTHWR